MQNINISKGDVGSVMVFSSSSLVLT